MSTSGFESPIANRTKVFISYSHKDKRALDRLQVHLKPYERSGLVDRWDDTRIRPGDQWQEEIRRAVAAAKVAVLLISADFLASEFIATHELPSLLAAAKDQGARILPVILRPCAFQQTDLKQFQAVNDAATPLSTMTSHRREKLWSDVAVAIVEALGIGDSASLSPAKDDEGGKLLEAGKLLMEEGEYGRAVDLLEQAAGQFPSDLSVLIRLGKAYDKLDRPVDSLKTAERVLAIDPKHVGALNAKAHALFALGREAEASDVHLIAYDLNKGSYFGSSWEKGANEFTKDEMDALYDELEKERNAQREANYVGLFSVGHAGRPSQATLRTPDQFVMVQARYGAVEDYMIDAVREVLGEVEELQRTLKEGEYLLLRGAFFDDKNAGVWLYGDLLHDRSVVPSLTEADMMAYFHDDVGWYGEAALIASVNPSIRCERYSNSGSWPHKVPVRQSCRAPVGAASQSWRGHTSVA